MGFHRCFLAARVSPGEPVLCMEWTSVPQAATCGYWAALSWRQMPCLSVWVRFRKCQICCGEVGVEQELSRKAWRKQLVKERTSKRSPFETGDGNWVAESRQGEDPKVFTTTRMLAHVLHKKTSQPCSELQGCNSTLRIWWLQKPPELCFDNRMLLDAITILLYVLAAWHFFPFYP